MISSQAKGVLHLHQAIKVIWLPVWFCLAVTVAHLLDQMSWSQVAVPTYPVLVALAMVVAANYARHEIAPGPPRTQWVASVRETNLELLVLAFGLFGLIYATKDKAISRQFIASFLAASWLMLLVYNRMVPEALSRRLIPRAEQIRTLIVGSAQRAEALRDWLKHREGSGVTFVGLATTRPEDDLGLEKAYPRVVGSADDLEAILTREQVQQVVLLETRRERPWMRNVVGLCQRHGVRVLLFSGWDDIFSAPLTVVKDGPHTFFTFAEEPLQNPVNQLLKRLLDLAVALPVCLLVLPPLTLAVWLAQRVQSPGPVFFRQPRSGAEGRRFAILKYRTMHVRPPGDEARQASKGDARIYAFGQLLRRTSLDEFPQFWNVLLGHMSIVGPRPHMLAHDASFQQEVEIYRNRHFVKPGITGMAQHLGFRGEILKPEDIRARIALDLEYIYTWSIWLDIGIILKTFWQVFFPPKSAY